MSLTIRAYQSADRDGCLVVFRSNAPEFFADTEEAAFTSFLDAPPGLYFVFDLDHRIVACGGYALGPTPGEAALCWGMVRHDRQREGLGTQLVEFRMQALAMDPTVQFVTIETSQHTVPFFQRFGFEVGATTSEGFAPGIDRVSMRAPCRGDQSTE